ncbi:MAG: TIR domain-containing protein [bacterium]|nr:TIR domain-containing protein [bacterium]
MKRVYLSYAQQDGEAALYLATQLRGRGIDVFIDYERLMTGGQFTRRMGNEIRGRDCLLLVQSPEALSNALVQREIRWAYDHNTLILPVMLRPVRDLGEFAFLLNNRAIDFSGWSHDKRAADALSELERLLRQTEDDDQRITLQTVQRLSELATLNGHESWVRTVSFSPNGMFLASGSNDNSIRFWDMRALSYGENGAMTTVDAHTASVWCVTFSPDGGLLASCSNDTTVRLWDVDNLPQPYEFTRFTDHHEPVYGVAFSADAHYLASASYDKSVHLRDIRRLRSTGREESLIALAHASHVYSVTFSPETDPDKPLYLVTASQDSTIRLWEVDRQNLRTMTRVRPSFLIGHTSWVNTVTFSPNGALLASTSKDKTIRLWDMASMREVAMLVGHTEEVNSVAFSPDGKLVASTSKDKTIRLWELASQRELGVIQGHTSWANTVAFSPDGSLLVTASGDGTIKLWGVVQQSAHNGARNGG